MAAQVFRQRTMTQAICLRCPQFRLTSTPTISQKVLQTSSILRHALTQVSQVSLQAILLKDQICTIQTLVLRHPSILRSLLHLLQTCLRAAICTTQTLALMHVLLQQLLMICLKVPLTSITQTHVPMLASLLLILML